MKFQRPHPFNGFYFHDNLGKPAPERLKPELYVVRRAAGAGAFFHAAGKFCEKHAASVPVLDMRTGTFLCRIAVRRCGLLLPTE